MHRPDQLMFGALRGPDLDVPIQRTRRLERYAPISGDRCVIGRDQVILCAPALFRMAESPCPYPQDTPEGG